MAGAVGRGMELLVDRYEQKYQLMWQSVNRSV